MLQNDAVRNLQYDNDIRVAQTPRVEPRVLDRPVNITSQEEPNRIPLPIATVDRNLSSSNGTYVPMTGYDFLKNLPSVHIEQSYELNESLTAVASENRYTIRSPLGEAIYMATESSEERHRMILGSSRPFQMHILDKTHQEALMLRKKFALGFLCCQPKTLEIWVPPGNLMGRVIQSPTFLRPEFYIEDGETHNPIFCIQGPDNSGFCCYCLPNDSYFKIHSGGDLRASIDHKWLPGKTYTTNVYFSDITLTAKERALIMGSAFLLEYIFFQK